MARSVKVGSNVNFKSKTHTGKGKVAEVYGGKTGNWFRVKTKDHPKGEVTVRESQVS